jgi:hypothetical protein
MLGIEKRRSSHPNRYRLERPDESRAMRSPRLRPTRFSHRVGSIRGGLRRRGNAEMRTILLSIRPSSPRRRNVGRPASGAETARQTPERARDEPTALPPPHRKRGEGDRASAGLAALLSRSGVGYSFAQPTGDRCVNLVGREWPPRITSHSSVARPSGNGCAIACSDSDRDAD